VHPFTRPVLTDTLCISPEPLKQIHHDPKTHFHIPYRENKNLTGTACYTSSYIKSVRLGSIYHILTRGSVHPFTQPVLTDTLCISPEPLKQIHRDPKTHFHIPYQEKKNLTGTARYTYIKSVQLGSIHHILTWGSVHPLARPVLTDTLCISPEPLKRIHCILSKRV